MNSATTTTHTLEIDGMTGDACVQKVTGALKGVHGVSTEAVKVGAATIKSNQADCGTACTAIKGAGFPAREHPLPAEHAAAPDAAAKTLSDQTGERQPRTPGNNTNRDHAGTNNNKPGGTTPMAQPAVAAAKPR